jgi:hypothetical protein
MYPESSLTTMKSYKTHTRRGGTFPQPTPRHHVEIEFPCVEFIQLEHHSFSMRREIIVFCLGWSKVWSPTDYLSSVGLAPTVEILGSELSNNLCQPSLLSKGTIKVFASIVQSLSV